MNGRVAGLVVAVVALSALTDACSGSSNGLPAATSVSTSSAPKGWTALTYAGLSLNVPDDWPVYRPTPYEFTCEPYDPGLYLPPIPTYSTGCSGKETPRDPSLGDAGTARVIPCEGAVPADATVVGTGAAKHWIEPNAVGNETTVGWPHHNVRIDFYGVDEATFDGIVASVGGTVSPPQC